MRILDRVAILVKQDEGTIGVDSDGDRWEKTEEGTWYCREHGMTRTDRALADDYPEFHLQFVADELVHKDEIRAALMRELANTNDLPTGSVRRALVNDLFRAFDLKPQRKIRVTLELVIDDEPVVWDTPRAAGHILTQQNNLVDLITNVEEVK